MGWPIRWHRALEIVFWCASLLGLVPAIASGVLFPYQWTGEIPSAGLDPSFLIWPLSFVFVVLLILAAIAAAALRSLSRATAILPLLFLALALTDRLDLDRSLLSSRLALDQLADTYKLRLGEPRPDPSTFDKANVEDAIRSVARLPWAVEALDLAPAVQPFRESILAAAEDASRKVSALISAPASESAAAARVRKARSELEGAIGADDLYRTCGEMAVREPEQAQDCWMSPRVRQLIDSIPSLEKELSDAERNLAAETTELAEAASVRRAEAIEAVDAVESRILALGAAGRQTQVWLYSAIYTASCVVALLAFAFLARAVVLPTAFALLAAVVVVLDTRNGILHGHGAPAPATIFLSILPALAFLVLILGLRFLALTFRQNIPTVRRLKPPEITSLAIRAAVYWSPFLLLLALNSYASHLAYDWATDRIYSIDIYDEKGQPTGKYLVARAGTLEEDIDAAVRREFELAEGRLKENLGRLPGAVAGNAEQARINALAAFDDSIPEALACPFQPTCVSISFYRDAECGWFDLKCRIVRSINRALDDVYRSIRTKRRASLDATLLDLAETSTLATADGIKRVRTDLRDAFDEVETTTRRGLRDAFIAVALFSLISSLLVIVAVVKSYLFIFFRLAFSNRNDLYATLADDGIDTAGRVSDAGGPRADHGEEYVFPVGMTFYVKRHIDVDNGAPQGTLLPPQWSHAILSRLHTGTWRMKKLDVRPLRQEKGPFVKLEGGRHFVSWQVAKGQRVFFDFRDFVALSDSLQISTLFSLRASSRFLGRMFFTSVTGPGVLVLRARGKPAIGTKGNPGTGISPSRLLSWDSRVRFSVESSLRTFDIYFSDIQVRPIEGQLAAVDVGADKGGLATGAARFVRTFLLPV